MKWTSLAVHNLVSTFINESASALGLILTADEAALATTKHHFGAEVATKFPSAAYEIDEAAKCLAFDRPTACVFHLMRALEICLKAVAFCLGVTPPTNPNWGSWLEAVNKSVKARSPVGSKKWSEHDLFQDIYQRLDAIKDAQRNSTLHVDRVYTEAEAKDVFGATRSFMQRVASRMDEKGVPNA